MPVAQSPAHYINSSTGCPCITESFLLCYILVLCATVAALPVVEPHFQNSIQFSKVNPIFKNLFQFSNINPFFKIRDWPFKEKRDK
jgi:hypothetical protein